MKSSHHPSSQVNLCNIRSPASARLFKLLVSVIAVLSGSHASAQFQCEGDGIWVAVENDSGYCADYSALITYPGIWGIQSDQRTGSGSGGRVMQPLPGTPSELGGASCGENQGTVLAGNPVNVATGNKHQQEVDFQGAGTLPLTVFRAYNSKSASNGTFAFGKKWSSTLSRTLANYTESGSGESISLSVDMVRPDGQIIHLTKDGSGPWRQANGRIEFLTREPGGEWTYVKNGIIELYYSNGQLARIENEYSEYHEYVYQNGRVSEIRHSSGRKLAFFYDSAGRVYRIDDPAGNSYRYSYDSYGLLREVEHPSTSGPAKIRYEYDNYSLATLKSRTDERGAVTRWTYASSVSTTAISSREPEEGNATTITYLGASNGQYQHRVISPAGRQETQLFEEVGGKKRLVSTNGLPIGNCAGTATSLTYDTRGYYDVLTDAEGNRTDLDHDSNGFLTRKTYGLGTSEQLTRTYTWHETLGKPLTISSPWLDEEFSYDGRGRLSSVRQTNRSPYGIAGEVREWRYTYTEHTNSSLKSISIDGPLAGTGDTWTRNFDSFGRLSSVVNPLGHTTSYSNFDSYGRARRVMSPAGLVTDLVYHPRGWITQSTTIVDGAARTTTFDYELNGFISRITFADGGFLQFVYDTQNRLARVENGTDATIEYSYDIAGNVSQEQVSRLVEEITYRYVCTGGRRGTCEVEEVVETTEQVLRQVDWIHDALNRLETETDYHDNLSAGQPTKEYRYDKNNRLAMHQNQRDYVTSYLHDALNRAKRVTDAKNGVTELRFNANGDIDGVKDPNGNWTYYERNGFGEVVKRISPDTGVTTYHYTSAGLVMWMRNAQDHLTRYYYDELGRIELVRYDGGATDTFEYDKNIFGNGTVGALRKVTDQSGSTLFEYNKAQEVIRRESISAGFSMVVRFWYDTMGRVRQIAYPGGTNVYYSFNQQGETTGVEASHPSFSRRDVASSIKYAPYGPLTGLTFGSGERRRIDRDLSYRIKRLQSGAVVEQGYSHDNNDNITAITDEIGSDDRTHGFDQLDRLDEHTGPGGSYRYTYDANGNRTSTTQLISQGERSWQHWIKSGTNQLQGTYQSTWTMHQLSRNGNTTRIGSKYFGYDDRNRLVWFRPSSTSQRTNYNYNAFGQRVYKSGPQGTAYFVYGFNADLMHERVAGEPRDYIYLNGELIAYVKNGELLYVHTDHLGRPGVITRQDGSVFWQQQLDAWSPAFVWGSFDGMNIGFPGQYYDHESRTFYNYFRTYDPSVGRYLQSDPIGLSGGLNTYSYVGGNPLRSVDPFGLYEGGGQREVGLDPATVPIGDMSCAEAIWDVVIDYTPVLGQIKGIAEAVHDPNVVNVAGAVIGLAGPLGKGASRGMKGTKSIEPDVTKVGGRKPINSKYAGQEHPSGVQFSKKGYPDFSPHAKAEVELSGLTGNYAKDAAAANRAVGLSRTPDGYVWHHVEDGKTMQLIPKDIHNAARHTGGAAIIRHGGGS